MTASNNHHMCEAVMEWLMRAVVPLPRQRAAQMLDTSVTTIDRIEGAGLAEHLTTNVYSLEAARAYNAQHRNVGLAWKAPGLGWIVDPAAGALGMD